MRTSGVFALCAVFAAGLAPAQQVVRYSSSAGPVFYQQTVRGGYLQAAYAAPPQVVYAPPPQIVYAPPPPVVYAPQPPVVYAPQPRQIAYASPRPICAPLVYEDVFYERFSPRARGECRQSPRHSGGKHGGGWQVACEFDAGGGGREVAIGGGRSQCFIEVVSGTIALNTVVVRRGGKKQPIAVAARLGQGQRYEVPIDDATTGLRISAGGKGRYRVCVK